MLFLSHFDMTLALKSLKALHPVSDLSDIVPGAWYLLFCIKVIRLLD